MNDQKTIYCLTGLPGSGKSTAAYELREWGIYPVVGLGDQIKEFKSEYSDDAFGNTWETAQTLREVYGDAGAMYPALSRISIALASEWCPGAIADGIRNPAEVELLRNVFPDADIRTVAIRAPDEKRKELFYKRGDFDEQHEDEQVARALAEYRLHLRTQREVDAGLQDAIDYADIHVWNDGDEGDLGVNMAGVDDHCSDGIPLDKLEHAGSIERNS